MAGRARKAIKRRSKNLSDEAIEQVVRVLDGWSGKLTWDDLIEALVPRLHYLYTRQALFKHERIKTAFALRKTELRGETASDEGRHTGPCEQVWARVERLEAENRRLEAENQRLLEQFVVWAYNAYTRGLTKEFLSQPLPRVNRGQTYDHENNGKKRK